MSFSGLGGACSTLLDNWKNPKRVILILGFTTVLGYSANSIHPVQKTNYNDVMVQMEQEYSSTIPQSKIDELELRLCQEKRCRPYVSRDGIDIVLKKLREKCGCEVDVANVIGNQDRIRTVMNILYYDSLQKNGFKTPEQVNKAAQEVEKYLAEYQK